MSFCINPDCSQRQNSEQDNYCQTCGTSLVINERYRIIRPLRELEADHCTEVFEVDNLGVPKVIKVLTNQRRRLVTLFEQEAQILKDLKHLSVSRVDNYFRFTPEHGPKDLHCLVLEKIPGLNLQQWIAENELLSEALAIEWLQLLVPILEGIHQQRLIHRDIKPSNIMVSPDGGVSLIDFGAARKVTTTYLKKLEDEDVTRIYTPGYTAPEQIEGQANYSSDFFALGRTFVHLLTGVGPDEFSKDKERRLEWRQAAPQISDHFANLIDELIAPVPEERLYNAQVLALRLAWMSEAVNAPLEQTRIPNSETSENTTLKQISPSLPGETTAEVVSPAPTRDETRMVKPLMGVLGIGVAIATFIFGARYLGVLQPLELKAFDHLMGLRPADMPDSRLLLVTVDEADIQYQNQQNMSMRWSLSDQALNQALETLETYQPRAIGLDIYRDFSVTPEVPELATRLQQNPNFFGICKVASPLDGAPDATPPPAELPSNRVGFSDFIDDAGNTVRRHLIYLTPPVNSSCSADYAFSLQLASHYLAADGIQPGANPDGNLTLGPAVLKPLPSHAGGYQGIDDSGHQILLNYRSLRTVDSVAEQISLQDLLENKIPPESLESLKDRIVLIGITAPSTTDNWQTPYSNTADPSQEQTPGVFIQAQMISQLLSIALQERSQLWWWSLPIEALWIGAWSLLGGILAWAVHKPLYLAIAGAMSFTLLFGISFGILTQGGWIPLVPAAIALFSAQLAVLFLWKRRLS
ncbi:Serine/threonine-protein kinase B [Acaryochloris thomasi RCC1774]|uniref:non-specific serine/threonine protein kinase n=1 Tax=Acaryochloris thomasi RCC1774 TaxID=1764569 RepID=A0A2W1JNN3_9CYAN|nr:CHASE2 domain-containing protein [Acaryochloris thomasi]PZD70861.1 Serine/threonine-protein kinase B [Acaryochloris thomasi RCC1774]